MTDRTIVLDVITSDGKYHVKQFSDGSSHVLRHGEAWPAYADTAGNLALALASDLDAARKELSELRKEHADLYTRVSEKAALARALTT